MECGSLGAETGSMPSRSGAKAGQGRTNQWIQLNGIILATRLEGRRTIETSMGPTRVRGIAPCFSIGAGDLICTFHSGRTAKRRPFRSGQLNQVLGVGYPEGPLGCRPRSCPPGAAH